MLWLRRLSQLQKIGSNGCSCISKPNYFSWFSSAGIGLQNAINDAEKLVGYPTSFNSWKYLFDEEPATFIGLASKIVGSGHPLLQTVRDILSQDPHGSNHLGGLWILLVSKALSGNEMTNFDTDYVQGIHHKQRTLAETTELINTAFLIHRNMMDWTEEHSMDQENRKTQEFGNKLFVLGGDYLLSKASIELAKIENTEVVKMIGKSIGDMAEGATLELSSNDCLAWTNEAWEDYVFRLKGSLMANSCKSTATIVQLSGDITQMAYEFGKNLVFAQHIHDDIEDFESEKQMLKITNYSLAKSMSPGTREFIFQNKNVWTDLKVNNKLKSYILRSNPNLVSEGRKACQYYINNCLSIISSFPEKESVKTIDKILQNIAKT